MNRVTIAIFSVLAQILFVGLLVAWVHQTDANCVFTFWETFTLSVALSGTFIVCFIIVVGAPYLVLRLKVRRDFPRARVK